MDIGHIEMAVQYKAIFSDSVDTYAQTLVVADLWQHGGRAA
jgi:hypothetical protein